jgi:hypothetical protein
MTRSQPLVFHVDAEHTGIRLTILGVLFISLLLFYLLLRWLVELLVPGWGAPGILACLGAVPLSLLLGWVAENLLKRAWPSGRRIILTADRLLLRRPDWEDVVLDLEQPVRRLWWSFSLSGYPRGGRERRLPANWRCVAGQLRQEERRIVPYCFVPPTQLEEWEQIADFALLQPKEVYDSSLSARLAGPSRPELPAEIVAGDLGAYWLAERDRWQEGVELAPEDFERLLAEMVEERRESP